MVYAWDMMAGIQLFKDYGDMMIASKLCGATRSTLLFHENRLNWSRLTIANGTSQKLPFASG